MNQIDLMLEGENRILLLSRKQNVVNIKYRNYEREVYNNRRG